MKKCLFFYCLFNASLLFAQNAEILNAVEEGNRQMQEAQKEWAENQQQCAEKILVNACLEWAKREFKEKYNAGKRLKQSAAQKELLLRQEKNREKLKQQAEKKRQHQQKLEERMKKKTQGARAKNDIPFRHSEVTQ